MMEIFAVFIKTSVMKDNRMMKTLMKSALSLSLLLTLTSCLIDEDPKPTNSSLLVERGDVVVTSFNTDSLVVFDSEGNLKRVLYQYPAVDAIGELAWNEADNEILVTVNGSPDRIDAISVVTGAVRTFYNNTSFFTGTPQGIAYLKTSGDIIASEGTTIERFSNGGIRETFGAIWPTNVHANAAKLVGLENGNWLSCSTSQGARIYPDNFNTALTAVATVTGPAGATSAQGCNELSDGRIVVAWAGTSDYIYLYSSTLTSPTILVNNVQSLLSNPYGVGVNEQDEIFVADATRNLVVKLDSSGNVIREFGNSILNSPRQVLVIPAFN